MNATRIFLLLILLLVPLMAHAALDASEKLSDPVLQTRAESLYRDIRCVVCQGQTIDGSDSEMAGALRAAVRFHLLAGDSDDAVRAFLRAQYGDSVLMKPPLRAGTWLLWFMPLLLLTGGGLIAARALRGRP